MQHLITRTPPSVQFQVQQSHIFGFVAKARDTSTGREAEVWAATELDARQRAEALVTLAEAS